MKGTHKNALTRLHHEVLNGCDVPSNEVTYWLVGMGTYFIEALPVDSASAVDFVAVRDGKRWHLRLQGGVWNHYFESGAEMVYWLQRMTRSMNPHIFQD